MLGSNPIAVLLAREIDEDLALPGRFKPARPEVRETGEVPTKMISDRGICANLSTGASTMRD